MTELSPLKGPIGLLATAYDTPLDDVRLLTPVGIAIGETDCADADFANACRWIGGELEWSNYVNALDHAATLHKKAFPLVAPYLARRILRRKDDGRFADRVRTWDGRHREFGDAIVESVRDTPQQHKALIDLLER